MKLPIPILMLAAVSACALPQAVDAQSRRLPGESRATAGKSTKSKSVKKHIASLLRIARDLRKSGQADVAAQIEAQARRLVGSARPRPTAKGKWVQETTKKRPKRDRADRFELVVPRKAPPGAGAKSRPKLRQWSLRAPKAVATPARSAAPSPSARARLRTPAPLGAWRPAQPTPMVAPKTASGDLHVVIPKDRGPDADDARIDRGRNRFRYSKVPTVRDSRGRVAWPGLPAPPEVEVPTTKFHALVTPSDQQLQKRVKALAKEVRAMRRALDKLSKQLTKERRESLIR